MRKSCVCCSLKHLGQARALMKEVHKGYPEHWVFAMGHMAEAEDELEDFHPGLAAQVRAFRKQLELSPDFIVPWRPLVLDVMSATGYSINNQKESVSMRVLNWIKSWAPALVLGATVAASSAFTISQPSTSTTIISGVLTQDVTSIVITSTVAVATLAQSLGIPGGDTTLSTEPGGVLVFAVVTNSVTPYVSATVGASYDGPGLGEVGVWDDGPWTIGAGAVTLSGGSWVYPTVGAPTYIGGASVFGEYSNGEPAESPAYASFTLSPVPLTNYYRLSSGLTTNHTVAVGDIFYITNGCVKGITAAP